MTFGTFAQRPAADFWPTSISGDDFEGVISSTIAPESWNASNGPGQMMPVDGELVVSQTSENQSCRSRSCSPACRRCSALQKATLQKGGTPTVLFPMETAAECISLKCSNLGATLISPTFRSTPP